MAIGRDLLADGDYMRAIRYFNMAIKAKPYLTEPFTLRGVSKMMLGDYDGAREDCSQAIALNKYKLEPYRVRGLCLLHQHCDSAALADFTTAALRSPADRNFLYYKSLCLSHLKQYARSNATLDTLLRFHPRYTPAYTARAANLLQMADTAAAVRTLQSGLTLDGNKLPLHIMLADIAAARGNWRLAVAQLDNALAISPHDDELINNRGAALLMTGDRRGAASDFDYALRLNPANKNATYNRRLLSGAVSGEPLTTPYRNKELEGQSSALLADLTTVEVRPFGLFALSFTHPYADMLPVAYPYPELAAVNASHRLPSGLYLSPEADETPDPEQALALFSFAEELGTETSRTDSRQQLGRAVAFAMLQDYDAALETLDALITAHPDLVLPRLERAYVNAARIAAEKPREHVQLPYQLASQLPTATDYTNVLADLDAALQLDPHMSFVWYDRGVICMRTGNTREAIKCYTRALEIDSDFMQALFNRGLMYASAGEKEAAAADLRRAGELGAPGAYAELRKLSR